MRVLKWISWGLAGLFMLLLLAVVALVWVVDPNSFKPTIEARVKQATGRDFTLSGNLELGFFPWLAVRTGAGTFGNAPGFGSEPMASWRSAQLGAKLFPLLRGEVVIDRVRLDGAEVRLVRHADGTANWQGIASSEPGAPDAGTRRVTVDGVDLTDSHVVYLDEGAPRRVEISALHLTTNAIAPDEPFTGTVVEGQLHMDGFVAAGVPFRVEVPFADLSRDYSSLAVEKFVVRFGALQASGGVSGKFSGGTHLVGSISTNTFDARGLLAAVGVEPPKTTDPKALTRVGLETSWRYENGAASVDPLTLTLDDTHLKGRFTRAAGEDAVGDFQFQGDALDLARYVPPTDPASAPFVLPTAQLRALKFRGVLELQQATYEDVILKGVTLRLVLDDQGLRGQPVAAPAAEKS